MKQQAFEIDHQGKMIRGMSYQPAKATRHPTVILLHGFTGQRMENGFMFVKLSRALAQAGIAAITFDFINSGESDGSFDQMLVTQQLTDVLRVTEWAQRQPFVDRASLGLLGFSLGGMLASCASARMNSFKSLAMLAPTTEQNICRHAKREGQSDACSIIFGPHCLHPKFFEDVITLNSVADVVKHPRPTLIVQGTEDTAVPPAVSQQFVDAMKKAEMECEVKMIEGADHPFANPAWRHQMQKAVISFFERTLGRK